VLLPGLGSSGKRLLRLLPEHVQVKQLSWTEAGSAKSAECLVSDWFKEPPVQGYCLIVQSLGALLAQEICSRFPPSMLIVLSGPVDSSEWPLGLKTAIRWATASVSRAPRLHLIAKMLARLATSSSSKGLAQGLDGIHPDTYASIFKRALRSPADALFELKSERRLHRIFDPRDGLSGFPKWGIPHKLKASGHLIENERPDLLKIIFLELLSEKYSVGVESSNGSRVLESALEKS